MPVCWWKSFATFGAVLTLGLGLAASSQAWEDHAQGAGPHGGTLERTKHYHLEVVLTNAGLDLHPFGMDGKPLDAAKLSGTATFYHPNSPSPWFERPLSVVSASPGQASALGLKIDLSKVPAQGAKVAFAIKGLPEPEEPSVSFTVPFTLTQASAPTAASRPAPPAITFARSTAADQPAIRTQRVCRVSGQSLGSMGAPIKAIRGDRILFLCCQSCIKKVQANPDQYFGALAAVSVPK